MYLCFKTAIFFFFFFLNSYAYLLIDKGMSKHVGTTLFKSHCLRSRIYRVYLRPRHWCLLIVWRPIHYLYIFVRIILAKSFSAKGENTFYGINILEICTNILGIYQNIYIKQSWKWYFNFMQTIDLNPSLKSMQHASISINYIKLIFI